MTMTRSQLLVGTYRMLPPSGANEAGGLYSDNEFDLSALAALRSSLVEVMVAPMLALPRASARRWVVRLVSRALPAVCGWSCGAHAAPFGDVVRWWPRYGGRSGCGG